MCHYTLKGRGKDLFIDQLEHIQRPDLEPQEWIRKSRYLEKKMTGNNFLGRWAPTSLRKSNADPAFHLKLQRAVGLVGGLANTRFRSRAGTSSGFFESVLELDGGFWILRDFAYRRLDVAAWKAPFSPESRDAINCLIVEVGDRDQDVNSVCGQSGTLRPYQVSDHHSKTKGVVKLSLRLPPFGLAGTQQHYAP